MPALAPFTHDDLIAAIRLLADAVVAGDWRPDYVIGIGRGGLTPACYLSHALGQPMLSVDLSTPLPGIDPLAHAAALAGRGARLLVVDDMNDSGATILRLRDALGASDSIRFAVLIDNRRSAARIDYAARVIDRAETADWFVFPWESVAPAVAIAAEAEEGRPQLG